MARFSIFFIIVVLVSFIEVYAGRIVRSPQVFRGPGGPPPPRPFGPGAYGPLGSDRFGPGGYSGGRFGHNRLHSKLPQVSISISKSISISSGGNAQSSAGSSARGK